MGDDGNAFEVLRVPAPPTGTWFFLVTTAQQLRYNRVQVRIFIDGRLAEERKFPGKLATTTNDVPVTIGASSASGGEAFRGNLDEVMILRPALNKGQVAALSRRCGAMSSDR